MKRDDTYYQALLTRDHRFDGKFFVGVKTTGIYCRPICPARPKRENVEFFSNHLAAENAGYRPCLRCRPESAPRSPAWIGKTAVVQRAIKVLHNQETMTFHENEFAERFGVTARHLRRLFVAEIGKTPKQIFFENRLNLARKLIVETALPISEIAFGAGFHSIRRFNDAFKNRFHKKPSELRRVPLSHSGSSLVIRLAYRPPFDFAGLLHFYRSHQVAGLEWFEAEKMYRVVEYEGQVGLIGISDEAARSCLRVEIDFPNTSALHAIIARVRSFFDLDSDPLIVANALEQDPLIRRLLEKHAGLRLPSGWDPFEVGVATILGQLVSVSHGRALVNDLVELLGKSVQLRSLSRTVKLFPTPKQVAHADLTSIKTTKARKKALQAFAKEIAEGRLALDPTQDVDQFLRKLLALPGIGPWTANYMALKVLRHTDAFPETDLILARALKIHSPAVINKMSPWRGYVASLFWREYAETLKKNGRLYE